MASDEWVVLRLKVQDRNRFIADTRAAGSSVRQLGRDAETAGGLFRQGAHHGFLWNQMIFTLRRTIYGLTLGVTALGTAAIVAGFNFNSLVEQQTLAFKTMTGSAQIAGKEVNFLFNLAAHGPFEFKQVIQGARQLMAFGFTVDRTNALLVSLQDAMAGMGLDQAGLDRATLALGQIQSSGRLLGQEVRQLEQLGLFNPSDFTRRLRLPPSAMANIGSYNVPSKVAIDAIMAYWKEKFKGAAKEFQHTWVGLWSTLKDISSQTFGVMTLPLQQKLEKDVLPRAIEIGTAMQKGFKAGGFTGAFAAIDKNIGGGLDLAKIWTRLVFAGRQLWDTVNIIATSFYTAWNRMGAGTGILVILGGSLWAIAHVLKIINPILSWLIMLWIAERTVLIAVTLATKSKIIWDVIETAWMLRKSRALKVLTIMRGGEAAATMLSATRLRTWAFATEEAVSRLGGMRKTVFVNNGLMARFTRYVWAAVAPLTAAAASAWSFTAALLANPITWIVLAVIALTAGLVILYFKWQAFHNAVNKTVQWLWDHPLVAAFVPVLGPLFTMAKILQKVYDLIIKINNNQIHVGYKTSDFHGGWWNPASWLNYPLTKIPGMQHGGHTLTSGAGIVGERGPELLTLPRGASVVPLTGSSALADLGDAVSRVKGGILQVTIPLYVDRRRLAEANASVDLDELARA